MPFRLPFLSRSAAARPSPPGEPPAEARATALAADGFPGDDALPAAGPTRLHALVAVFLTLLVVLLWLVQRDPYLDYAVRRWIHGSRAAPPPPDDTALLERDPPLGSRVALPSGAAGAAASARGVLLVFVEDCASCLGVDLQEWERKARESGLRLVLLAHPEVTDARIATFRREARVMARVTRDADRRLARRLNAAWPGRAYLLTRDGRLVWKQAGRRLDRQPFADEAFGRALRRL